MFGKPLFNTNIAPMCEYCANGRRTTDGKVLCKRVGVAKPDYKCSRFEYDPLKRIPKRRPKLPTFSPEDFKL